MRNEAAGAQTGTCTVCWCLEMEDELFWAHYILYLCICLCNCEDVFLQMLHTWVMVCRNSESAMVGDIDVNYVFCNELWNLQIYLQKLSSILLKCLGFFM